MEAAGSGIAETLGAQGSIGEAQKPSNDSWKLFTVSCCKSCPFMLIYRKRDLKLHESVANRGAAACPPVEKGALRAVWTL